MDLWRHKQILSSGYALGLGRFTAINPWHLRYNYYLSLVNPWKSIDFIKDSSIYSQPKTFWAAISEQPTDSSRDLTTPTSSEVWGLLDYARRGVGTRWLDEFYR